MLIHHGDTEDKENLYFVWINANRIIQDIKVLLRDYENLFFNL